MWFADGSARAVARKGITDSGVIDAQIYEITN